MSEIKKTSLTENWTSVQAYALAVVCLLVGVAVGWLFRGSQSPAGDASIQTASAAAPSGMGAGLNAQPTPEQMKKMADTTAAPQIEKLKSDPNNPELLASIGNVYYDVQIYPTAIDYYQRALQVRPADVSIRTDLGTADWYTGNTDRAIEEFNKALSYDPNNANTLFNLGIVKWQGKMDIDGAVAAWQKLLEKNPNYAAKDKVEQLMAQAKKHQGVSPATPAKGLPQ
ncbi:MAG TPA: tetratricopeptide repeat protein [Candidatus Binatia bacterium]|jgi:cytochrome c-type biogenesis protein CcmH/NrfG|nr:tetratricopeptide repeat protein [Candidatus Binatia bacterium]